MSKYLKLIFVFGLGLSFIFLGIKWYPQPKVQAAPNYPDGTLIKAANDPNIYIINNGLKVWIRSIGVFNLCGYDGQAVKQVQSLDEVPTADLIKVADSPDVYRLEKNFRRKLASIEIFNSYNLDWRKIATVCPNILDSYYRAPIMKIKGSDTVYKIAYENPRQNYQTTRHRYLSMQAFLDDGMSTKDIVEINQLELESYGFEGDPMREWARWTPSAPYLFDPGLSVDTGSGFTISWTHPGGQLTFILEQATNVSFSDATAVYADSETHTIQILNPQRTTKYYYRVKALNKYDESTWSNTVDMNVCFPVC